MSESNPDAAQQFDPFTPVLDPYTPLKEAASRCPVVAAPNGAVVVTGAANVAAVFKDSASFRNNCARRSRERSPAWCISTVTSTRGCANSW